MRGRVLVALLALSFAGPVVGAPRPFAAFGTGVTEEMTPAGATWRQTWTGVPWAWWEGPPTEPGFFGPSVTGRLVTQVTGAPIVDMGAFQVEAPFAGTIAFTAHSLADPDRAIGTITGDMTDGLFYLDFDPDHMVEDVEKGLLGVPFGASVVGLAEPDALIHVTGTTGIFADLAPVGVWQWHVEGMVQVPRVPGLGLVDNALAALAGQIPIAGAHEEIVLTGAYEGAVGWASCSYGIGISNQLSPSRGIVWEEAWGQGPWGACGDPDARSLFGPNVSADLQTRLTGTPRIDMERFRIDIPFAGTIAFTAHEGDRDGPEIGRLAGTMHGIFHLDIDPGHARVVDGHLAVPFGCGALGLEDPEAVVAFTEACGIYEAIDPMGAFAWCVKGEIRTVRVPDLDILTNIFAALQEQIPVVSAEEEISICGRFAGGARPADLRAVAYRWGRPARRWNPFPFLQGWLHAKFENRGAGTARNVTARLEDLPSSTVSPDPVIDLGTIPGGEAAWSLDSFSVVLDVTQVGGTEAGMTWTVEYDDELGFHHVVPGIPHIPSGG